MTLVALVAYKKKNCGLFIDFIKMCSENMQQIYRRTPMSKGDFNKATLQLYWNNTSAWVFSCKYAAYFQSTFLDEHLWSVATSVFNCRPIFGSYEEINLPPQKLVVFILYYFEHIFAFSSVSIVDSCVLPHVHCVHYTMLF